VYITDDGLLVAEAGDPYPVTQMLRKTDYGAIATGEPIVGVNHVYAVPVGYGKITPAQDGTAGCASRVASGKAPYYPQVYMSLNGAIYQVCRLTRAAIHCEGTIKDPGTTKTYAINKVSIGIEWAGSGWFRPDGTDWTGPKGRKGWNQKVYQLDRPDFQLVGKYYWQKPSDAQIESAKRFWRACVTRFAGLTDEAVVHGHGELGGGSHSMCPGPLILSAMHDVVYPFLKGAEPAPPDFDKAAEMFDVPDQSIDPEDFFADHLAGVTNDELYANLPEPIIECLVRSGYITHDNVTLQMSDVTWFWTGPDNGPVCEP